MLWRVGRIFSAEDSKETNKKSDADSSHSHYSDSNEKKDSDHVYVPILYVCIYVCIYMFKFMYVCMNK